jgi:hypothetical protein
MKNFLRTIGAQMEIVLPKLKVVCLNRCRRRKVVGVVKLLR